MFERWVGVALLTALFIGFYHVFTRQAAGKIPDLAGGIWLELSALVGMILYAIVIRQPFWGPAITRSGLLNVIAGGLCVGLGTVLGFTVYRLNGPLSAATPIILLGALLVSVLVGTLALGESLTASRGMGIAFAATAIWLLAR